MVIDVVGDGIYLALVDTGRYESFVQEDWDTIPGLLEPHFVAQMKRRSALVWGTGVEADWQVDVVTGITATPGHRELVGGITVSADGLYLCNYDSLSMAAQFNDHFLPDRDCQGNRIPLAAGNYRVRVVQLADPKGPVADDRFRLEFEATETLPAAWPQVPWSPLR